MVGKCRYSISPLQATPRLNATERLSALETYILSTDWGKVVDAMRIEKVDERESLMKLWRYRNAYADILESK